MVNIVETFILYTFESAHIFHTTLFLSFSLKQKPSLKFPKSSIPPLNTLVVAKI